MAVDGLERKVRWTLACFAAGAGVTAFAAVLLPGALAAGLGWSELDPESTWPMAAVAALAVLCAALGAMVAAAPRRYAHLLPVLALGLAAAGFSLRTATAVGPLAAGGVAALLAAVLAIAYLSLWLAESPSDATLERDRAIFEALLTTLVPPGGRVAFGAADPRVERAVVQVYRRSGRWGAVRLRLMLRLVDGASLLVNGRRFDQADPGARELVLERLLGSPRALLRRPVEALRATVLERFYADPRVQAAIGYDDHHLRTRLQEGPNAVAHSAALAAASARAAEGDDAVVHELDEPAATRAPAGPTVLAERSPLLRLVRAGPFRP